MQVTRILGDCPDCGGKNTFGNVLVSRDCVLRGCPSCEYKTTILLPKIRKKIIYLDQFFFSNAFKDKEPRFVKAAQKIQHLSSLQLLVAPFSSIHEHETHQWRKYKDLMKFIRDTSRGHMFEMEHEVKETQITRAFKAFLKGSSPAFTHEVSDAIRGDIHDWDGYVRFSVVLPYIEDIEQVRDMKRLKVEALVREFPVWRKSTNTFDQDVALFLQDAGKEYFADSYLINMLIHSRYCFSEEIPHEERLEKISQFLVSEDFAQIPRLWLWARSYATLKDNVKRGAHPNPEKAKMKLYGFNFDVKHIATYAPYCDAFVMDKEMAKYVADSRVGLEKEYGVKVFSVKNWDDLLDWLDALEAGMSEEHKTGLSEAYGGRTPFELDLLDKLRSGTLTLNQPNR